jgi:hypothetical protein
LVGENERRHQIKKPELVKKIRALGYIANWHQAVICFMTGESYNKVEVINRVHVRPFFRRTEVVLLTLAFVTRGDECQQITPLIK